MFLTTSEKRKEETVSQLITLWKTVFGDDEEYIKLLVPYLDFFDCYAIREDVKIISAFYLLPSEIRTGSRIYKGRYLYAAATYEEYRKNGYMSRLINEAIKDKENELDFISLVPANEGLYSYYARFGFESVMYNYVTELSCKGEGIADGRTMSTEEVNFLRKECFSDAHFLTDIAMEYAFKCYGFFGSGFLKKDNNAFLYVEDENTVYEALLSVRDKYLSFLENGFKGRINAVSPYALTEKSEKVKCGMIKAFNPALKNEKEIYMNHTLM